MDLAGVEGQGLVDDEDDGVIHGFEFDVVLALRRFCGIQWTLMRRNLMELLSLHRIARGSFRLLHERFQRWQELSERKAHSNTRRVLAASGDVPRISLLILSLLLMAI